jgi:hypothetical protein
MPRFHITITERNRQTIFDARRIANATIRIFFANRSSRLFCSSALVLIIALFNSKFRGFSSRHPGVILVLFGVASEIIIDLRKVKTSRGFCKLLCEVALVAGLFLEISDAVNTDDKIAGLESKLKHRRITAAQMRDFKLLTEHIEKTPIKIISAPAGEAVTYAHDIREMLTYAGFKTNVDANPIGINILNGIASVKYGADYGETNVFFVLGISDESYIESNLWMVYYTNDFNQPIVSITNDSAVYPAVMHCFIENHIISGREGNTDLVGPGQRAIFIMEKQ